MKIALVLQTMLVILLPTLLFAGEWASESAFRVTAPGVPDRDVIEIKARRESAKTVAVALARARVVEELAWAVGGDALDDPAFILSCRSAVFGAFREEILGGRVVDVKYGENEECTIIFQVESPNLRARLAGLRTSLPIPQGGSDKSDDDDIYRSPGDR